jgi:hypothetical protein
VRRRGLWTAFALGFYTLLAAFLVYFLRDVDWAGLAELHAEPAYLLLAVPFSLAPRLLQPFVWAALIRDYGERPPAYPQLALVYAKSWLARYIPGKLVWIGGKVLFGMQTGVRGRVLAVTAVAEAGIQLLSALALAFLLFAVAGELGRLGPGVRIFALAAMCAMSAGLAPPVFNAVVSRMPALANGQELAEEPRLSMTGFVRVTALAIAIHASSALPLFLLLKAIYAPLSAAHVPFVTASFLLAGSLGTLAVFAPSGIGVREGVLLALIGAVIPKEVTVLGVVLLRLWSLAMDLLFYVVALLLDRHLPPAARLTRFVQGVRQ